MLCINSVDQHILRLEMKSEPSPTSEHATPRKRKQQSKMTFEEQSSDLRMPVSPHSEYWLENSFSQPALL